MKHDKRYASFVAAASAALTLIGLGGTARAADGVSVFVEPSVGFTAVTLKALEIETAFIRAEVDENGDPIETDDWSTVDPSEFQATVGRRAYYEGTGFSCGVAGGVRLFGIQIGAAYTFDTLTLDGFSKRYRYMPEKLRAGGRKFLDDGRAEFHRIEVMLRYIREIPQDECPGGPAPCLLGNAQIALASATEIRFGSIGFRYNSGNRRLEMSNDGGTSWPPLVTDVSGLTFSYFNQTAAQLTSFPLPQADREDVRRIVVDLQLARGGESAHLRTSVYLRSFMNEVSTSAGP